ncbi:copper resistance protein CopC [soil metagenome]
MGLVASLTLLICGPVSAGNAHDELIESTPADGVELQAAPEDILLEFSGDIAPVGTVVKIEGPSGEVTDGEPHVEGTEVAQLMQADTPPGDYAVTWRVTSSDGHPISGEFSYSVASAGPEAQGSQTLEGAQDDAEPDEDASSTSAPPPPPNETDEIGTDRAANTAAAPVQGDTSGDSSPAWWVWGVLALAIVTLGGLGAVAVRRR